MEIRRASIEDAADVADVWLRSRKDSANPPGVHTDDDVHRYFRDEVLVEQEVWVAIEDGRVVAMMATKPGWIEHLHVAPEARGCGIGSALLSRAKQVGPIDLWTFQANEGARRFYERHGFVAVMFTDDDNEERAPDVRYHWSPH